MPELEAAALDNEENDYRELLKKAYPGHVPDPTVDWCDIRRTVPVNRPLRGAREVFGNGVRIQTTLHNAGWFVIDQLFINGEDKTKDVQAHDGGRAHPVPSGEGHNCRTSDYYLAWQLTGPAVDFMIKQVPEWIGMTGFYIFTRYTGPSDDKIWLYGNGHVWVNAELVRS